MEASPAHGYSQSLVQSHRSLEQGSAGKSVFFQSPSKLYELIKRNLVSTEARLQKVHGIVESFLFGEQL